jgi:hypothetical protein
MFNFLFAKYSHNTKAVQTEYTPELPSHPIIHDLSEGGEFLDDPLTMTEQLLRGSEGPADIIK